MSHNSDSVGKNPVEIDLEEDVATDGDTEATDNDTDGEQHSMDLERDNDRSPSPQQSDSRIVIINTVLAYIHYGISSATADNVLEVVRSHFTEKEIISAKETLWRECDLGEPQSRYNSKGRRALDAHADDIVNEMYKVERDGFIFHVESSGIARLPRFNAECLNVVAIDRRIADLNEQCFALKLEASSYRSDYLRCQHDLNLMKTVLQQHTDALRDLRNTDGTFGPHPTAPQNVPVTSPLAKSTHDTVNNKPNSAQPPSPKLVVPRTVTSQLSVTSDTNMKSDASSKSVTTPGKTMPTDKITHTSPSYSSVVNNASNSPHLVYESISSTLRSQSSVDMGRSQHQRTLSVSTSPTVNREGVDSDGFQRSRSDIRRDRNQERSRRTVVYGTRRVTSRLSDGLRSSKQSVCDLFVYHVSRDATTSDLREYMRANGIDTAGVRIDIASHKLSEYKSFRVIAARNIREQVMSPDFWPVDVRIKDYERRKKNSDTNNFRRDIPQQQYNTNYGY